MTQVDSVSSDTAKLLKDITGESHLDSAVRMTVEDALHHRLEKVEEKIEEFDDKYGMSFEDFREKWENGEIEDKYSYDVEKDYWEWEGLVTRKQRIQEGLEKLS
ncbi:MAG: hypothetical protein ABEI53_02440 [Candidatus Magasanikbacteria bacterium]